MGSWAVFTPFAIMSSWYRDFSLGAITWMKIHLYLNVLCCLFTTVSFILAFIAINSSGSKHFNGSHQILGLLMFLLVIIQSFGGFMRPPKVKQDNDDDENTTTDISKERNKRRLWEISHKFMGYFLLVLSLW